VFPTRKEYEVAAEVAGGFPFRRRARLFFRFKEATLAELCEFQAEGVTVREWVVRFLLESCVTRPKGWQVQAMWDDWQKLWDMVRPAYFGGALEGTPSPAVAAPPFGATLATLAKELSCDPLTIMERYTLAQVKELSSGLRWNANELTKEGRAENARTLGKERVRLAKEDPSFRMALETLKRAEKCQS
jgi:hypothetical protein